MKKNNIINLLTYIGYGTHPYSKKDISKLNYYGIDADNKEINRLKKYKSKDNIKLYYGILGDTSKENFINIYTKVISVPKK